MGGTLDYHNFSIYGDPRWAAASRITRCAPIVVLTLFFLSIIQICLGAVWVVDLKSEMTIPKILQTLILPGLAFFNTLPSLHLHMLLRRNPPVMVMWFSGSMAVLWLVSCILWLATCTGSGTGTQGLKQAQCAKGEFGLTVGVPKGMWDTIVAFGLISTLLYSVHTGMAVYVWRYIKKQPKPERQESVVVDPELALEARRRWDRIAKGETI